MPHVLEEPDHGRPPAQRETHTVTDVVPFALLVAVVSVAGLLAVWSNRLSERIRVPAPAIFLVAAAVASHDRARVSTTCPSSPSSGS